jgi:serine/threonine protein kinase
MYKRYFHNTDVWSLGVILYGLLTDKPLFHNTKNFLTMVQELQKFELSTIIDELDNLEKNTVDLLEKMLQKNPSSRISIKDILKHKFITRSQ